MKFGKDLEQYKCAGWEDQYIDYKGLKLILKNLEQEDAIVDEVDADFFQALEDELEKVRKRRVGWEEVTVCAVWHMESDSITAPASGPRLPPSVRLHATR